MTRHLPSVFVFLIAIVLPAGAADHAWLIGGGPEPTGSQAQIEFNVSWVREVLARRAPGSSRHLYYTDGADPAPDVVEWKRADDAHDLQDPLLPLSRVLGLHDLSANVYRSHRLQEVSGTTEAGALRAALAKDFAQLRDQDRVLIVYNGHGMREEGDPAGNHLRLWGDSKLTVRELTELLSRIPPKVPVRLVLTQCFSGGFSRIIRPLAASEGPLAPHLRCAFMAESEDREAEGCSAGVVIGDYRDYTTYFFAALDGRTRQGGPLAGPPDRDHDGRVTPFEAHLYAMEYGHNADLPRSTSEVWLEAWMPWYLRWFDSGAAPDNVYGRMARVLAERNGFPPSGRALVHAMTQRLQTLTAELKALEVRRGRFDTESEQRMSAIQSAVYRRWPALEQPFSHATRQILDREGPALAAFIRAHADYPALVTAQDGSDGIDPEHLRLERDLTQIEKIRRLRGLARALDRFERHAGTTAREAYQRLRGCEEIPL